MVGRWIGKDLDGGGSGLIEILQRNLPGGTENNHENHSQYSRRVPGEIRTEHLPNTSQEPYRYANVTSIRILTSVTKYSRILSQISL
jgi:hypothetical protein